MNNPMENRPTPFSNTTYDKLKWVAQYALPSLATLYFALAQIWGLPYAEQVVGTIAALDTFLGLVLGVSTKRYNKNVRYDGSFLVDRSDPKTDKYTIEVDESFDKLAKKDKLSLKVKDSTARSSQ